MKYKFLTIALLFTLSLQAQFSVAKLDSIGNAIFEKSNTTGAYLSILKNDSVIYSHSYGYRNKDTRQAFDKETVFPISSNTKAFNCILLSQLVEQGKLNFTTPIKEYLPDVELNDSYLTNHVTTLDLLTHRVGLPRYDFAYISIDPKEQTNTNKIVFDRLKYMQSVFDFRTTFGYGNCQYIIAAYLYERITNEKWEDGLSKYILQPLSMKSTHCDYSKFINTSNKSQGYVNGEKTDVGYNVGLYTVSGMGNMFSTISDMEKWCRFLIQGNDSVLNYKLLKNTQQGKMSLGYEEPFDGFSAMEYGLGWFIFDYWGHKVVLHHGDNTGHQTIIVLLPDDGISWVIVANEAPKKSGFPFRMSFSLLDVFANKQLNDWTERLPDFNYEYFRYPDSLSNRSLKSTLSIGNYCGEYKNEGFGSIKIIEKDNELFAETGTFSAEIEHWKGDSFRMNIKSPTADYIIHFKINENKEVVSLITDLVEENVDMLEFVKVKGK